MAFQSEKIEKRMFIGLIKYDCNPFAVSSSNPPIIKIHVVASITVKASGHDAFLETLKPNVPKVLK